MLVHSACTRAWCSLQKAIVNRNQARLKCHFYTVSNHRIDEFQIEQVRALPH